MKKLFFFLITITILTNVSYASFPVTEQVKTEIIEIPIKVPMSDNQKILLYSLVPIPAAIIGAAFFSGGTLGFILGTIVGAIAILSAVYSLYLNFTTDMFYWDWRNYVAVLTALVLGLLAFFWTMVIIAFGGIG